MIPRYVKQELLARGFCKTPQLASLIYNFFFFYLSVYSLYGGNG